MNIQRKDNIYLSKNHEIKRIILLILIVIDWTLCTTGLILIPVSLSDFNAAVLGLSLLMFIAFGFLGVLRSINFSYLQKAIYYSSIFMEQEEAFIEISKLGQVGTQKDKSCILKNIEGALKKGYLINCTIEIHSGVPKLALAKKIVKDICQSCGAPIVGAENNLYRCEYCGNKISNVINKK
jgi:hypothetical protein